MQSSIIIKSSSSFFQIKTAIREREKAMEMKNRLLRILDDRDAFLEKLAESRKKAFEVQYVYLPRTLMFFIYKPPPPPLSEQVNM